MQVKAVIQNITLCVVCSILCVLEIFYAVEYYLNAEFYNKFVKFSFFAFLILHPIILFFYNLISISYLAYISDEEFNELLNDNEYYETIYFRDLAKTYKYIILPITIYLTLLNYVKLFSLYSLRFLIEEPKSYIVFRNVISTTLYNSIIIHTIFQSFPLIIMQIINNLLIKEDQHDYYMRGVVNFPILVSTFLIMILLALFIREKGIEIIPRSHEKTSKVIETV